MKMKLNAINAKTWHIPIVILVLAGFFYVYQAWSPSSYAVVLYGIGAPNPGLVAGMPKTIRSDEWAVYTPQIQATINNHFQRINQTSYYHEDLRYFFSLPLHDWALIFKPAQWGFLLLSPPYAYSLQWYLYIAFFIYGYALLFFRYQITNYLLAWTASFLLYFAGYVQTWWTILAPCLTIFPWVLLATTELATKKTLCKVLILYWILTCWFLGFFYPPAIISLTFAGAIIILALKKDQLTKRLVLVLGIAGALCLLTTFLYLKDYLLTAWNSVYPGNRSVNGGDVPIREVISMFIPSINTINFINISKKNICESSSVGNYLLLYLLFFLNYKKGILKRKHAIMILSLGTFVAFAWMLLPISREIGTLLLFDKIPPYRMKFAAGILFYVTALYAYKTFGVLITKIRCLTMLFFVLAMVFYYKLLPDELVFKPIPNEIYFVIGFIIITLFIKPQIKPYAVLALALAIQIQLFGLFNPIQSTKPIFAIPRTKIVNELARIHSKMGYLEETGYPGATLNGLGFKSVSHVLTTPHVPYWHKKFPTLEPAKLDYIFNRYAHIALSNQITSPILIQEDLVVIPRSGYAHHN